MFVILFIILQLQSIGNSEILNDARKIFLQVDTMEVAEYKGELWSASNDETVQAYGACMYFMQARFAKNPITKWGRFKKGKKQLERIISRDPNNVELRYLRLLFQSQMPEFLGYYQNKEEDFNYIMNHIDTTVFESDTKCLILRNIANIEILTPEKRSEITKKIEKC